MAETTKHPILIVDDEPEILYSLRGLLRKEFDLHTAQSGYEAMQVLQRQPIHVVMADQRMPGMTGVELLTRVQQEHPEAIRLVFTGYADIKAVIEAINKGHIYRYLTKPWDPDELRAVLQQACAVYEEHATRRQGLNELHTYLTECLGLLQGLTEGRSGTLTPEGRTQVEQLTQAGTAFLQRLDNALAREQSRPVG